MAAIIHDSQLLLSKAVDAFIGAERKVLLNAESLLFALDMRGREADSSEFLQQHAVIAVAILNGAIALVQEKLDWAGTQSDFRFAFGEVHVQLGQILLDNGKAFFAGRTASRPFHHANDALRIELHLYVQIARGQLNAVQDAFNLRRRSSLWIDRK